MLIEIQCTNLSDFDAATGRSGVCGHRVMVDSAQVGQMVNCPKCEGSFEVVASKYDPPQGRSPQGSASSAGSQAGNTRPKSKKVKAVVAKAAPRKTAQKKAGPGKRQSGAPAKHDIMDAQFSDEQLESKFAGDSSRCKKCGSPAPYGRCSKCRYVEPRFKKMHQRLDEIKVQNSGMMLWLTKSLSDGISVATLKVIGHVCVIVPSVLVLFLTLLLFLNGYTAWGIVFLTFAMMVLAFYGGIVYKAYQFTSNPRARIAWFQKPFWNFVLLLARIGKWENYDQRLTDRRVIKIKDPEFTDQELPRVSEIRNVQVLDLENTQVSDKGIAILYRLEHLQCVVLKRTHVSQDAIFRLQQTFPKLWIWY